mmetsp:Transcript_27276/g.66349  ORF Transcript_27276/g.66349 Transcript_27276/m.66349 type:complete len:92 (-) Transcript_27276:3564-3839(-)
MRSGGYDKQRQRTAIGCGDGFERVVAMVENFWEDIAVLDVINAPSNRQQMLVEGLKGLLQVPLFTLQKVKQIQKETASKPGDMDYAEDANI